jgi:6-phosphogluconate dehydrogenase
MGGNLARQALDKGFRVVGYERRQVDPDLTASGLVVIDAFAHFRDRLSSPRVILMYIPAGVAIDQALADLLPVLDPGDVVMDGGNSYWGDSLRRHAEALTRGVHFADVGTSGGVEGARHGACFMAGGDPPAIARLQPILSRLCVEGGYVDAGPPGAGHFTKLVHNGIEFGMLQAIGEGVDLLDQFRGRINVADVLGAWQHGSVIRCWLLELLEREYRRRDGLHEVPGYVEDTGEVNWLVGDAMEMEVPIPVITQAVLQLLASRDDRKNWARAIAMMRHGFGGHPYGPQASIADYRHTSRVGGYPREARREGPDTLQGDAAEVKGTSTSD